MFLVNTSWHHTGSLYNVTDFYTLNLDAISEITKEEISKLVKERKEHLAITKEERQKEKEAQEERRKERDYEKHIKNFTKISTHKTENGLLKAVQSGRVKLEDLEELKVKKIEERRKQLEPMWKNDPNAQEQYSRINDDEFIWENYL